MTQKYVQLMEDLQYNKRELQNWKHKNTLTEQELQTVKKQNQDLKKTIEKLQETNSKLSRTNRYLSEEKQSIISDLSTEMSSFKQEITKKQRQIISLKEIISPSHINQDLVVRQMKFQLTESFEKEVSQKERKIEELTSMNQKLNYQKQIERKKYDLKVEALEKDLKDLQNKHNVEIQEYSNKLFKQTPVKPPEERQLLRRLKRDNQELKRRFELVSADLSQALEQKTKVHKDYSTWMKDNQKQISVHQNQIVTYKEEIARLNDMLDKTVSKKDEYLLKERQRDIKKLKNDLEQYRDQTLSKDKKISDLQVQKAKLQGEIKMNKQQQEKVINRVEEADNWEKERLKKQLSETIYALQRLRGQHFELNDKIQQVSLSNVTHKKRVEEITKEEEERIINIKRQRSEQMLNIHSPSPIQGRMNSPTNNEEDTKKLEDALRGQKGKLRDFLAKYIELKKKYELLQKKLKKANDKIMELLQQKIILKSPKATTKHFEFPTQPQTRISPPKQYQRQNYVHLPVPPNQQEEVVVNSQQNMHFVTTADFKPFRPDPHSKTNPVFNRQFLSPQDNRHMRIQDESVNSRDQSYYQKSMKMKNKRFRELKCTNHENSPEKCPHPI